MAQEQEHHDDAGMTGLRRWFAEKLPSVSPPISMAPISGGNSNLTHRLACLDGTVLVLRCPPGLHVLSTAHDMVREWRAISCLGHTAVPVPRALALCTDPSVIGVPFYVMGHVDGCVQHSLADALATSTPDTRQVTARSLIDVLADLHAVDIDAVGLADHGARLRYIDRQLDRWHRQYQAGVHAPTVPDIETAHAHLQARTPAAGDVSVVHGDYRLGNLMLAPDGAVSAVLDWEISTLGDPLADVAYTAATWARPDSELGRLSGADELPSMAPGYWSAAELLQRYSVRSGRDLANIDYFLAFNHWRYACIVHGIISRRRAAQERGDTAEIREFEQSMRERAALAVRAVARLG